MSPEFLDYGLAALLLALTVRTLFAADLAGAIVSFMGAGLVAALIWARLAAPDIAIAEAAIGAGITGALLFVTWQRLGRPDAPLERSAGLLGVTVGTGALVCGAYLMLSGQPAGHSLSELVQEQLGASGVANPVTAVLLNYRSFDTLMEIAVLFLTLVAVQALGLRLPSAALTNRPAAAALARLVAPVAVLLGAYMLWAGASYPGGAFQAGAVWAGALLLLHLSASEIFSEGSLGRVATWGLGVFIAAALATYAMTDVVLAYTGSPALWILVIEVAAALAIAATLYLLVTARAAAPLERAP